MKKRLIVAITTSILVCISLFNINVFGGIKTETSTLIFSSENMDGCVVGYIDCSYACPGLCNGFINLHVVSGSGSFNYLWNTGATTEDLSDLCAGVYVVTVTDVTGCTKLFAAQIQSLPEVSFSTTVTNALCGECNGAVELTVTGSLTTLNYHWSNGSTDEDLIDICSGGYTVTVSNSLNCTTGTAVEVGQDGTAGFALTIDSVDASNCSPDACNGSALVIVSGGMAPFNYTWSNGGADNSIYELCGGDYTVTVTDAASCSKSATATINCLPGKSEVIDKTISGLNIFPNPLDQQTTIQFTGADNGFGSLEILNVTGVRQQLIFEGEIKSGNNYSFNWNTSELANGIYICRLNNGAGSAVMRLVKIE